jgi:LacI family transcriptional regulator
MAKRGAGIREVAAAAGLSVTTVSHALNDARYGRVSRETRERVRAVAAQLGYRPSGLARALRANRSATIGVISDRIATTPYAVRLLLGAQEVATASRIMLLVVNTDGDPERDDAAAELLLDREVDGVLYASVYHRAVDMPQSLQGTACVLADAYATDRSVPSVVPDEVGGARAALDVLAVAGHRRIGFLNDSYDIPASRARLDGYLRGMKDAGLSVEPQWVVEARPDSEGGYQGARKLLSQSEPPTGIFCFNDRMAMGVYRAAAELNLVIPQDLSVVGFDDLRLISEGLYPKLTTVALPHREIGAVATAMLLGAISDPSAASGKPLQEVIHCDLVERNSVSSPAGM